MVNPTAPVKVSPEEMRAQVVAETRRRFRGYVVAVAVVSLAAGGLIGFYGLGGSSTVGGSSAVREVGITPPPAWGAPALTVSDATGAGPVTSCPVTSGNLHIYVSGAVSEPQVVAVPPGSLVVDALAAAGGARADADLDALNLAAPLADHQHVRVPSRRSPALDALSSPAAGEGVTGTTVGPATLLVDINAASAVELEALPHIGATRAADIVAYREAHGPFAHSEEIQNVPGIGPAIYETLAPLITTGP
jgi:competence protein ComEA